MLSIALATYNGEKYLREQLDSILRQTIQDFELIICDDCSNDSTLQILSEYAAKDQRIKIFPNEQNLGFKKNFERAISLCSGDYIALSDQDDVWLPQHLQVLMENIGQCDLIGANATIVDQELKPFGKKHTTGSFTPRNPAPRTREENIQCLCQQNYLQGSAMMMKRSLLSLILPFPDEVSYHDWWIALVAAGKASVTYVDTPILLYRRHGGNQTGRHKQPSTAIGRIIETKKTNAIHQEPLTYIRAYQQRFGTDAIFDRAAAYHENCMNGKREMAYYISVYEYIYEEQKYTLRFFLRITKRLLFGV